MRCNKHVSHIAYYQIIDYYYTHSIPVADCRLFESRLHVLFARAILGSLYVIQAFWRWCSAIEGPLSGSVDVWLVILAVIVGALIALNVLTVTAFIWRKRRKRSSQQRQQQQEKWRQHQQQRTGSLTEVSYGEFSSLATVASRSGNTQPNDDAAYLISVGVFFAEIAWKPSNAKWVFAFHCDSYPPRIELHKMERCMIE